MDRGPFIPTEPTSVGLERSSIRPKSKPNDVGNSKDRHLYLSATEGKMFTNENSNGSFLARLDANKKNNTKNAPNRRFFCKISK